MPRIRPLSQSEVDAPTRAEYERQIREHGRMTNMKCTLAHSLPALKAFMEWYPLRDEVTPFLGERAMTLFVHAISSQTDCLICSTFFRRHLIDWGEDPDHLKMDSREQLLVEYGRQLAVDSNAVSDDLFGRLAEQFENKQIVALTAFGAMMVATNVFNNALQIDLDDYLQIYRKGAKR